MRKDKKNKIKVIVDVERMKHPFTGLFYYCRDLALNLDKYHSDLFDFHFFAYPRVPFPKHLKKMVRSQFDKYYLAKPKKYKVWHSTWQDTKYVPKNDIKFVYTIHDLNFLYTDKPQYKKDELLKAVQQKIIRADAVTVISNFVKKDVEKNLDTLGKEIVVIYNGVDFETFPNFDTPSYKPKKKFLFSIGTVLYKKHFHVLPSLLKDNDYELIIGGIHPDKKYIKQIEQEIKKHDVADRVHLLGSVTAQEKYWYMNNCEAFLFPSISEGFGLPPIEAMRLGKPTFLSTFTSLPEIGGEHAYYFDSFEPEAMRKVLKEGIEDYNKNNKKEAIITWSNQFNWEKASAEYAAVYKKVLHIDEKTTSIDTSVDSKKEGTKITAIIPTLNEESNIAQAIKSLDFADEIIVIDSLSTDKTVEIATSLGAKILLKEFVDFSTQKNFAIAHAKNDWIYILDADERVSNALKKEINKTLLEPNAVAYAIKMNYYFMDKLMKHGSFKTKKVTRLFHKKFCKYDGRLVHEQFIINGELGMLTETLDHNSDKTIEEFVQTQNFYATLKASELYKKNDTYIVPKLLVKPPFRFFKHYILQLGFLDGLQGFVFASIQSYGVFLRYIKLWSLKHKK